MAICISFYANKCHHTLRNHLASIDVKMHREKLHIAQTLVLFSICFFFQLFLRIHSVGQPNVVAIVVVVVGCALRFYGISIFNAHTHDNL